MEVQNILHVQKRKISFKWQQQPFGINALVLTRHKNYLTARNQRLDLPSCKKKKKMFCVVWIFFQIQLTPEDEWFDFHLLS